MKRKEYYDYVVKANEIGRDTYDAGIKRWRENFDSDFMFGYTSPGQVTNQIHLESLVYRTTKDKKLALKIKELLLEPMKLCIIFPENVRAERLEYKRGVPLLEPLFQLHVYINGYLEIRDLGILSEDDDQIVKESIIRSIIPLIHCPEWGAHNRSMLRASAIVQAYYAVGECEDTKDWIQLADSLAEESMGRWSIEDAAHYIPLWLFANIMYAKYRGIEDEYYAKPQTKYYFDYVTHFLTPNGRIPGFGDSWFHTHWQVWSACLEMGATKYKCGKMKRAAKLIFDYGMKKSNDAISPGIGNYMAYSYKWSDDSVEEEELDFKSEEVLDEVIGKKIAFRGEDTYMLYNYRDEGAYSYIPRRYLRTSIPVKAEKMHHGHGDENSIVTITKGKDILLHEGGYRDRLPNGKYRADMYHNKLSFREGIKDNKATYDKLHDDGYYKHVVTEKIHFQSFDEVDYLRTRNHYEPFDLIWDRAVTYIKENDVYIIVDWVENTKDVDLTIVNNIHTQYANKIKDGAYDTYIDTIQRGTVDKTPFKNTKEYGLLVEFISNPTKTTCEKIRRNHGDATMLSEVVSKSYKKGQREVFVSALTIHKRDCDLNEIMDNISIDSLDEAKDCLSISYNKNNYYTYKLDLNRNIKEYEEDRAPAYTWETGKAKYNRITTDCDFTYVHEKDNEYSYGMVNGCGIYIDDKLIYKTPQYTTRDFLYEEFNLIDHKWRTWNGKVKK